MFLMWPWTEIALIVLLKKTIKQLFFSVWDNYLARFENKLLNLHPETPIRYDCLGPNNFHFNQLSDIISPTSKTAES